MAADGKQDRGRSIQKLYKEFRKKHRYLPVVSWTEPLKNPLQRINKSWNDTFLHMAIRFKQNDLVEKLIQMLYEDQLQPPPWDIKNNEGNNILHEMATSDSFMRLATDVVKDYNRKNDQESLLTARNKLGETPAFRAARHGQIMMFAVLAREMKLKLKSKGPEDWKPYLRRDDGTTVLHISIFTESFELAHSIAGSYDYKYLIEERDNDLMTPLQYLACNPNAFGRKKPKTEKGFMEELMETTSLAEKLHDWFPDNNMTIDQRNHQALKDLVTLLVIEDTTWHGSKTEDIESSQQDNGINPQDSNGQKSEEKELTAKLSPKMNIGQESGDERVKNSQGNDEQVDPDSKYKKGSESPLLLATISNIPEIVEEIPIHHPEKVKNSQGNDGQVDPDSSESPLPSVTISNIPEIVEEIPIHHPEKVKNSQGNDGQIDPNSKYKKGSQSPLLLATISNIPEIVEEILIHHPETLEHTNNEGMNILHLAILYRHTEIFDMAVKYDVLTSNLLSATDDKGNSLLHMVCQKRKSQASERMQTPAFQLQKELLFFQKVKSASKMHLTKPLNMDNKTAEELFATTNEKLHGEAKEWLMHTTENCTILSVFIATVAFAAAYTVPGGSDGNTGIPVLHSKPFFLVFILADVFSLALALTSMGIFLSILTSSFPLQHFQTYLFQKLKHGMISMIASVTMMAVAFGATVVLIMTHNHVKIIWYVVAFLPVPIFFLSYSPLRSAVLGRCTKWSKYIALTFMTPFILLYVLFRHFIYIPVRRIFGSGRKKPQHDSGTQIPKDSGTQIPQDSGTQIPQV